MFEEKSFDTVETAIIQMLECGNIQSKEDLDMSGPSKLLLGQVHAHTRVLHKEVMHPKDAYTYDMSCPETDEDYRLFSDHHTGLVRPVWETIGDQAEMFLLCPNGDIKWMGARKRRVIPRGITYLGKLHTAYETHFREIRNGVPMYGKEIIGFNSKGQGIPMISPGSMSTGSLNPSATGFMLASLIEDATRIDAVLASVTDGVTLRFPVAYSAYKDFFSDREEPLTPAGRRKRIVHWVRRHARSNSDKVIERHTRGTKEIIMDGIRVHLEVF